MTTSKKVESKPKKDKDLVVIEPKQEISVYQQQQMSVENMISQAIQSGVPVETMERVLAMRKELKDEYAKEQFDNAMAQLQTEMPIIAKKKDVDNKYKYATIDSIVSQTKDLIGKHGFSYITKLEVSETRVKATCIVKHIAGHSETSEMDVPMTTKTNIMSAPQQVAATGTFAKRYAFLNAFGIMTGDEDNEKNLKAAEEQGNKIQEAMDKLGKCMDMESFRKTWSAFPKEIQGNKEVVMFGNEIISNIRDTQKDGNA
jgi:hypothetical protein